MNTEKLEKLKKSLDNKFIPDNMKDKIRAEIKKLEADIKTDETITATEVKEEVKEIEKKVEKALEVAEEKEEKAEAKKEEAEEIAEAKAEKKKATKSKTKTQKVEGKPKSAKKSVFSIAKEIRKDGETWEEAKDRARKMMKSETTEAKKKTKTETQKLLAMVRRNKEYKKLTGTSDLPKDAQRRALPRGKRVSANGNVYYENRANRVDVGGFKNAYLENGGGVDGIIELKPLELIPLSSQLNRLSGYNWTSGYWESEDGGKPSIMPNSVIVNVHTKQKFRLSPFYIYEGYDHYNSKPLYRVEDASEEGEYVGEWYTKIEDAEQELKEMFGSYADKGVYVETLDEEIDLTDDGKPRVIKTQQGGSKSFGERREMHGASAEALAFDNGGVVLDNVKIEVYKSFHGLKAENYFDDVNGYDWNVVTMKRHTGELVSSARGGKANKSEGNVEFFTFDYNSPNIKLISSRPSRVTEKVIEIQHSQALQLFKEKMEQGNFADGGGVGQKKYNIKFNVGKAKYVINYHDGVKKHKDGSDFYDMEIFKTKPMFDEFQRKLIREGYKYTYAEGGTIIGTPETPLARGLDIDYTGLVGETGGMSAGEMFAGGGSIGQMVNFEDWQLYDRDTDLERMKKSCNAVRKNGFKAIVVEDKGMYYVLYKSMSDSEGKRVYAEGGSLGNHGLKQGDQIIKTMSGGVQKVKTKSGDIVYVNLANGYRGAEPPLPFAKGGYTNERRHVNKAQDYEVRYAKNKPNRTGYLGKRSFDDGGISNGRYEVVKVIGFDKNGKTLPKNEIKVIADFDSRKEALNFVYEQQFKKDVTQRDIFIRDTKTNKTFADGGFMTDPNFGDFQNGVYATGGVTKNYINRNQLNTITIKKGDKKLTYKVSDVYNGAYKLEDGGNLERTAFYVSKRNVVKVQLKDGKDVKVANGYWIKKGAKPIHTSKYDDGGEIRYEDYDDVIDMWDKLSISQRKKLLDSQEDLEEYGNHSEIAEDDWDELDDYVTDVLENNFKSKMYAGGGSTNKEIEINSEIEKIIEEIKSKGKYEKGKESVNAKGQKYRWDFYKLENPSSFLLKKIDSIQFKNYGQRTLSNSFDYRKLELKNNKDITIDRPTYKGQSSKFVTYRELVLLNAGGGKTTFKEKATAIAKKFEGKEVEPKYQKEYGKTYDKAEAKKVGNKIAGSQKAKYDSKMSGGGSTKRGGAMQLAKEIRKDGESWQSALKRANEQMRNK